MFADALIDGEPDLRARDPARAAGHGPARACCASARERLTGILNGIDEARWDPAARPAARRALRRADDSQARRATRRRCSAQLGLRERADVPLFGIVSRLTEQKGVDLVAACARRTASPPAVRNWSCSGSGEPRHRGAASSAWRATHPRAIAVASASTKALAHRIEAGADLFLMPSRFEPCGLNQMYSQRYGTLPIVRATGGLVDSIVDATPEALDERYRDRLSVR